MSGRIHRGIVAAATCAVLLLATTPRAHADCCDRVRINNLTSCSFIVAVLDAGGAVVTDTNVYPMQSNAHDFNPCLDLHVQVRDMCGNRLVFPRTAGTSIDVLITNSCCVHILCLDHCTWKVAQGTCDPC